jgi:predicted secreted protein
VEAPDQQLANRVANSFNVGFSAGKAGYPKCDKALKAEAAELAKRGQSLSEQLARP